MLNMNSSVNRNNTPKPKRNLNKFRKAISKKIKNLNKIINFKSDRNQETSLKSSLKTNSRLIDSRKDKKFPSKDCEFSCTPISRRYRNLDIDCKIDISFQKYKFYRTSSRIKLNSTAIKSEFDCYSNSNIDFDDFYQSKDINRLFTSSNTIPYSDIFLVTDSFREQIEKSQQKKNFHSILISTVNIDNGSQTSTPMPERYNAQFTTSFISCQEELDNSTQVNLDSPIIYEKTLETSSCSNLSDDLIILQG